MLTLVYTTNTDMAYDETLAARVREELARVPRVQEKKMMAGLTFMVNDKMCAGVLNNDLMLRISKEEYDEALEKKGCRPMDFTGKPMKGFVFVGPEGVRGSRELKYWMERALAYNQHAPVSKKKK